MDDVKYFTICGEIDTKLLKKFYKFAGKLRASDTACINVSSEGGDPDVALAIVGIMRTMKDVTWITQGFGYVHSSASLIFCAGSVRRFSFAAFCMVHEGRNEVAGDATTIKLHAKHMERFEHHWNTIMEQYTGTSASTWAKLSEKDTYIGAEEALKLGIATEII